MSFNLLTYFILEIATSLALLAMTKEFILEIDQIYLLSCTGNCSVKPFQVIQGQFILPERIVNEDTSPLSSLRFVAGHSIRILQLQGIVVLVLPYSLIPLLLRGDM